jgi:hypothetical protein
VETAKAATLDMKKLTELVDVQWNSTNKVNMDVGRKLLQLKEGIKLARENANTVRHCRN